MRVLHVDAAREWRGGQTQLLLLATHAPGRHVVALPPDAPLRGPLEASGVPVHPVPFRGWLSGARPLARLVSALQPDVIAAHTPQAHAHALKTDVPVIVHRRVDFPPGRDAATRARYAGAAGYVAVSQAVRRVLVDAEVPEGRIDVVYDGIDVDMFTPDLERAASLRRRLGVRPETRLVGALGALVPHKGHAHLIDAMALLARDHDDVAAIIAGEGSERRRLLARIRKSGAPVHLLGRVGAAEVPGVLGAIEVLAHPSVEEGLGQAVLEAMAAGVPVVASRAGGLVESLADGANGLLVPPGEPVALAEALTEALERRTAARERAGVGRRWVREHATAEIMARATVGAYRRLLVGVPG